MHHHRHRQAAAIAIKYNSLIAARVKMMAKLRFYDVREGTYIHVEVIFNLFTRRVLMLAVV